MSAELRGKEVGCGKMFERITRVIARLAGRRVILETTPVRDRKVAYRFANAVAWARPLLNNCDRLPHSGLTPFRHGTPEGGDLMAAQTGADARLTGAWQRPHPHFRRERRRRRIGPVVEALEGRLVLAGTSPTNPVPIGPKPDGTRTRAQPARLINRSWPSRPRRCNHWATPIARSRQPVRSSPAVRPSRSIN